MKEQQNAQTEERSLVPELPPEGYITAELSLQEASLVRTLLSGFIRQGGLTGRSERARYHGTLAAQIALHKFAGPTADPGLPAMAERSWPQGTTFYQFTTFDMEAFTEYTAFLPASGAVTSYLFSPNRRKADSALLEEIVEHGNRLAKSAPAEVIEHRLNVNNSKIAWSRRHPDGLVDFKARNLNYFAPVLAAPPAEGKILESFSVTI